MTQSVLISIRPEWCNLIGSGKKTIEVRKTAPKIPTPFKCYIYCTMKTHDPRGWLGCYDHDFHRFGLISPMNIEAGKHMNIEVYSGKVIGEFVCDWCDPFQPRHADFAELSLGSLVPPRELYEYSHGKTLYGWHITDLKLYAEPREINEFKRWSRTEQTAPCAHVYALYSPCESCTECNLKRAPQSWCYIEEVE